MNNIVLKERNKIKESCKRFKSKMEDVFFLVIERLPGWMIPSVFMKWAEKYIDRRIAELEREQVKVNWDKAYLEQAVKELQK